MLNSRIPKFFEWMSVLHANISTYIWWISIQTLITHSFVVLLINDLCRSKHLVFNSSIAVKRMCYKLWCTRFIMFHLSGNRKNKRTSRINMGFPTHTTNNLKYLTGEKNHTNNYTISAGLQTFSHYIGLKFGMFVVWITMFIIMEISRKCVVKLHFGVFFPKHYSLYTHTNTLNVNQMYVVCKKVWTLHLNNSSECASWIYIIWIRAKKVRDIAFSLVMNFDFWRKKSEREDMSVGVLAWGRTTFSLETAAHFRLFIFEYRSNKVVHYTTAVYCHFPPIEHGYLSFFGILI